MIEENIHLKFVENHNKNLKRNISYAFLAVLSLISLATVGLVNHNQDIRQRAQVATTSFLETFDGTPTSPEPFTQVGQDKWDVAVHVRNVADWDKFNPMQAHHGSGCEAPLTATATAPYSSSELVTHLLDGTYEQAVFKCNGHIMTSINGAGTEIHDSYALIYLTPNHMVDFTNGEATIKFNVTTFRTNQRDWIDVWITPWEDNLQLPFDLGIVDLQGVPKNAVHFVMFAPNNNEKSGFRPEVYKNFNNTGEFQQFSSDYNSFLGYEDYLPGNAGDPKRRDTFEIKISKNHLKICMPQDSVDNAPSQTICWADKTIGTLPFTKGVVQFGHHSYTPDKDCSFSPSFVCGADTWHWDDFSISPSIPFTIIKGDKRFVENNGTVTFKSPAPANSYLRFSAIGKITASYNGGAGQVLAEQPAQQTNGGTYDPAKFSSYFVPIPQGTTTVRFTFTPNQGYSGPYRAKDFAIWSQTTSGTTPAPTSTPAVSTPTPLPTALPASPTPTNSPTPTPTRTPTPTPTRTPTPTPTSGVTPTGTSCTKTGDLNCDNQVGILDLSILLSNWNTTNAIADINRDGAVGILDLSILLSNWGL